MNFNTKFYDHSIVQFIQAYNTCFYSHFNLVKLINFVLLLTKFKMITPLYYYKRETTLLHY